MGSELSEGATLWGRAKAGDPAAFGEVFDEHRDRVFGQALRLMRSSHDAEDVTALVFLEAWRRRSSVRVVDGSIIAWLLVTTNYVAKNAARTAHRHRMAMATIPPPENSPDFSTEVDDRVDGEGRAAEARAAFARLSKNDQDVITLCVIEELTLPHAATVLGVPVGTVKSRLSRAKQRLADHLTEFTQTQSAVGGAR
jgi:RNA polymerase sigma factor (sigma-70 family)